MLRAKIPNQTFIKGINRPALIKKPLSLLGRKGFLIALPLVFCPMALANLSDKKTKQLCYFKNNYIKNSLYSYRPPFFYAIDKITNHALSVISLRSSLFSKNLWELEGVKADVPPLSKGGSIVYWFKYSPGERSNPIDLLCKASSKGFCLFKALYEGDLRPAIQPIGDNSLNFSFKRRLKVSIHDGHNNILRFAKDCSE